MTMTISVVHPNAYKKQLGNIPYDNTKSCWKGGTRFALLWPLLPPGGAKKTSKTGEEGAGGSPTPTRISRVLVTFQHHQPSPMVSNQLRGEKGKGTSYGRTMAVAKGIWETFLLL